MDDVVERKMPARMILIIVVVIILLFSTIYFISRDEASGITAKEGYEIAKLIVEERYGDSNFTILLIQPYGHINNHGIGDGWKYYISVDQGSYYDGFMIEVYSNLSHHFEGPGTSNLTPQYCIDSWLIDSSSAFDIALSNDDIALFLHHNPSIGVCQLSNDSVNIVWQIEWCYDAGFDDPKWAEIHIDATTGEVLYVEADN